MRPSKHHFPSTFQEIHETHFYQLICRRPRISQNTTFRKTGLVKLWLTFDSLQEATTILEWVHTKTEYIIWIINTLSSYLTRSHLPGSECTPRACHPWARPRPGSVCRWQASEWISCFLPRSGSGLYLCRCPTYVPPTRCRERVSDREWKWLKKIELQHFTHFKFKHRKNCKWCPLSFVIVRSTRVYERSQIFKIVKFVKKCKFCQEV